MVHSFSISIAFSFRKFIHSYINDFPFDLFLFPKLFAIFFSLSLMLFENSKLKPTFFFAFSCFSPLFYSFQIYCYSLFFIVFINYFVYINISYVIYTSFQPIIQPARFSIIANLFNVIISSIDNSTKKKRI